ncbi:MAG: CRTAC1 family protein [Pirellulaceae bacterium]
MNDDLYPDLVITNEYARDVFLLNQTDGTFKDATRQFGAEAISMSGGLTTGDLNGDGFTDIYTAGRYNLAGERILGLLSEADHDASIRETLAGLNHGGQLWLGGAEGVTRGNPTRNAVEIGWSFAPAMADLDNDGRLDLLVGTGLQSYARTDPDFASPLWQAIAIAPEQRLARVSPKGELDANLNEPWDELPAGVIGTRRNLASFERNRVLIGHDHLEFHDVSPITGLDIDSDSRTLIACDIDRDGGVDLLVASVGGGPLRSFRNTRATGNWLGVQLVGSESNAYGIGARITASVGDRKIVRDLFPATSFLGNGPAETHFGLGSAETIDELEIRWPSGHVTRAQQVPVNQWTRWSEETDTMETLPPLEFEEQTPATDGE